MKHLQQFLVFLIFSLSGVAHAATATVVATGTCPADPSNIQTAIDNAAPGDTIQLLPGHGKIPFNFTCNVAVTIQTAGLTIIGMPGVILINGSGTTQAAIRIFSDNVTVSEVNFQNFGYGILATNPDYSATEPCPASLTVTKGRFVNNALVGVAVLGVCDHFRFTNNTVRVPAPVSPSAGAPIGLVVATRDSDLLVAADFSRPTGQHSL